MTIFYIFLIFEIIIYKSISKFFFVMNCQSLPKEDVSEELKQWNFSWYHAIYYLAIIISVLKPLTKEPITQNFFLLGLIPALTSIMLIVFCNLKKTSLHVRFIDFLFIEGLAIQTNSWFCSLLGFIYLIFQIVIEKIKKK